VLWFVLCWGEERKDEGVDAIRLATFLQMVCRGAAHHKDAPGQFLSFECTRVFWKELLLLLHCTPVFTVMYTRICNNKILHVEDNANELDSHVLNYKNAHPQPQADP
jgi:hypothetical protein